MKVAHTIILPNYVTEDTKQNKTIIKQTMPSLISLRRMYLLILLHRYVKDAYFYLAIQKKSHFIWILPLQCIVPILSHDHCTVISNYLQCITE